MADTSDTKLQQALDEVKRQCLLPADLAPFAFEIKHATDGFAYPQKSF